MRILKFKQVHCKNCYKCVRHCPVKAIGIRDLAQTRYWFSQTAWAAG
ncbi:4Fe-4S binding protein [Blautia pseudococcoides]|nr:4Fe-4S binding protein [Blautia pseudococcoides]